MTGDQPLFPGYTDGTVQWRAESMQLVNWGGFEGWHEIRLDADTTLIAGATGSGKSTILDAYTALMMPSRVAFNSASNEATIGRARSSEQRSILTYLRGKQDMSQDATGTRHDQNLRGQNEAVWGGIAMTFRDEHGGCFSAVRVYLASPSTERDSQVLKRMFTLAGPLDLRTFDRLHDERFQAQVVKAALPGVQSYDDNYSAFSDELFRRLGIAGELKALELLARVQAGKQVSSVTALFTELVLEKPATFEMADRAISHFGDLERLYNSIATDDEKQKLLQPIADLHARLTAATHEVARLDTYGVRHDADQPFDLWAVRLKLDRCRDEIDANRVQRDAANESVLVARQAVVDRKSEWHIAQRELQDGGGDALTRLSDELDKARASVQKTISDRGRFDAQTAILDVTISTAATYAELKAAAQPFLEGSAAAEDALSERILDVRTEARDRAAERDDLIADLDSFRRRDSLVPRRHAEARAEIAAACGMSPDELPFAAELMDLRPECEEWRRAAEVTLRGVGLTMLMDERRQAQIRQRIDPIELGLRLQFNGVDLSDHRSEPEDPDYVSGRLQFKDDSPFVWWVKRRIFEEDHLCVDSPAQLGGDGGKVTRSGQTSRGTRGAHGRDRNQQNILGFSNQARCRELEAQVAAIDERIKALASQVASLAGEASTLRAKHAAYLYLAEHSWEEIDVDAAKQLVGELEAKLDALRATNLKLAELEAIANEASNRHDQAIGERTAAEAALEALNKRWERLTDDEDALTDDEVHHLAVTTVTDEITAELDTSLTAQEPEPVAYGPQLTNSIKRLRAQLRTELHHHQSQISDHAASLNRIFTEFNRRWPDPNRGDTPADYEQFDAIFQQIIEAGLFARKQEFQVQVTNWTSNDLIQLRSAYNDATREVQRRLEPINETLSNLPFGAGHERLAIAMRERRPEQVRLFVDELKRLTDRLTDDLTYEAAERRYEGLLRFIDRLRAGDAASPSQRDALLDVRRHIEITARRIDTDGNQLSTYTTLSGKSGGESQELIAFISGAALRFQLADDTESKPRFAPVFLDEGFVKADSEHAGRAVEAWRALGFQLILAVPLDKVTGLDRHVQLRLSVNKHGPYSRVTELREHRPEQMP